MEAGIRSPTNGTSSDSPAILLIFATCDSHPDLLQRPKMIDVTSRLKVRARQGNPLHRDLIVDPPLAGQQNLGELGEEKWLFV